jgi:hypothetical protein
MFLVVDDRGIAGVDRGAATSGGAVTGDAAGGRDVGPEAAALGPEPEVCAAGC